MFDFVDKIYCINLPESVERWASVSEEFKRIGIYDRVQPVFAPKPPSTHFLSNMKRAGQFGCTMSHLKAIGMALNEATGHVAIFEDDIIFHKDVEKILNDTMSHLPTNWDILYLGGQPSQRLTPVFDNTLFSAPYMRGTYGYVVNRNSLLHLFKFFIDQLMCNDTDTTGTCDSILGAFAAQCRSFIPYPMVVTPAPCYSLIGDGFRDYNTFILKQWRLYAPETFTLNTESPNQDTDRAAIVRNLVNERRGNVHVKQNPPHNNKFLNNRRRSLQRRQNNMVQQPPTNPIVTTPPTINFFWRGDRFSYLNRLCILSHVGVGHQCVMWLSGPRPRSNYWIDDLQSVEIKNADTIIDVSSFLAAGGNLKTASDLWSFSFLYEHGGIYCDTDAIAIRTFPKDDWILVSSYKEHPKEQLSIGVMAAPPRDSVFLNCITNIKAKWGNVTLFADEYKKIHGNTNSTHDDKLFYPFNWTQWQTLFTNIEIPDVYSIHLYHTMLERNGKVLDRGCYDPNTLIGKIIHRFDKEI